MRKLFPILIWALVFHTLNAETLNNVKICVDPNWMPMESIDKKGEHIGIVADVLSLIEKKTNFNFILIPTKDWDESLLFTKQGKCDVLPLASVVEERKEWLSFTPFYMDYPEALVVRASEKKMSLEEVLRLPIGLTEGYGAIKWFKDKYPNINIVEVEDIDDAFNKLRNKEIYSYSDTLPILGYKLQEEGILDLKISYAFSKSEYGLNAGMAVRKDKIKLYEELSQAINNLTDEEFDDISDKWVNINIKDIAVDYTFVYQILGGILIIILIILYWNYRLNLLVKEKTKEIQKFVTTLEDKVEEKTKDIKHLLNNAGQGFLTFNNDFLINSEYSKECEALLGNSIANKDISKIFFQDDEKANDFRSYLQIILGLKNKNAKVSAMTLLPNIVTIKEKIITIKYKIASNKFMLILTDISENKKLEDGIKNERNILKMIVIIIRDNDIFFDIKNNFEYFTNNIKDFINTGKSFSHNVNEIYRAIHTFKGTFLQLFMDNTASHLHDVESQLSHLLENDKTMTNEDLLESLEKIHFKTFVSADLKHVVDILGNKFLNTNKFMPIDKQSLKKIEDKCLSLIANSSKSRLEEMLDDIRVLSKKSLKSYLDPYIGLSLQVSRKIHKPIYEFETIGDSDILLPEKFKPFIQSLGHVFRNSLTHGIETSEARDDLGKDTTGTISCSFKKENDYVKIEISDDGAGINVEKIKEKTGNDKLSEKEAFLYIFEDTFSTKSEANELAGRGVGLSAVKAELDKVNGKLEVHSELNIGTRFVFSIPFIK